MGTDSIMDNGGVIAPVRINMAALVRIGVTFVVVARTHKVIAFHFLRCTFASSCFSQW